MTDFNLKIAANPDDGYSSAANFNNDAVSIGMGYGSVTQDAFFRFSGVTIPKGATITTAILRFNCRFARSGTTFRTNIHVEDADDPAAPTNESDLNGRSVGSAVTWDGEGAWLADADYDSPDFASILTTHLARDGWASGQALMVLILDDGSDESADRHAKARDYSTVDCAELRVVYETGIVVDISDNYTIDDSVNVQSLTDDIQDELTIADEITASGGSSDVSASDDLTVADQIAASSEIPVDTSDTLTVADAVSFDIEYYTDVEDAFSIADLTDCLNWSEFLRANQDQYLIRYYFTLTGAADGTSDIEIPVSSIQARKRSGYSTQVSVVIKDYLAWAAAITARPNGSMYIDMAYLVAGVEQLRERILIVDLDDIRLDKGSRSRAITLTGTRVQTFGAQVVAVPDPSYRYLIDGKISYRFPVPDPWLDPGNTCVVGDDEFTVDWVNYVITENYRSMEVREV